MSQLVNVLAPRAENAADAKPHLREFEFRKEIRALERRYLPFLKTVVDFDIACEIGFHQLAGSPLTIKQLLLLKLAPPVTIFRRLDRLCKLGIIERTRSLRDRRVQELRLKPDVLELFANCGKPGEPDAQRSWAPGNTGHEDEARSSETRPSGRGTRVARS